MGRDMHFYGGEGAVFAYHSPDSLIGSPAGLIGQKVVACLYFLLKPFCSRTANYDNYLIKI